MGLERRKLLDTPRGSTRSARAYISTDFFVSDR
jgi:hypothetical protein